MRNKESWSCPGLLVLHRAAMHRTPVAKFAPVVQIRDARALLSRRIRTRFVSGVVAAFTNAVAAVFGDGYGEEVLVDLIGQTTSRSGVLREG